MQPIRIYDANINLIAEIDNYESLQFQRKMYNAGNFTIKLNYGIKYASELQKNRIISLGNSTKKVGIIKGIKFSQSGNKKTLEISGYELKGIFRQRITIPAIGDSHIVFTTDHAETILKTLVSTNQSTAGMAFTNLDVIADAAQGATGTTKSRYQNLALELERIGRSKEVGNIVQIDYAAKKMQFDVIIPRDYTATTSLTPVIFSTKYDNIVSQDYYNNDFNLKNYTLIGGQGSGAARTIEVAGTLTSNFDLSVDFVDARDIDDSASLISRGNERLAQTITETNFDCVISELKPFVYEVDYDLGDKITIKNEEFSVSYDKIIEEITEFYSSSGKTITAVFGTPANSFKKYIDIKSDYGID